MIRTEPHRAQTIAVENQHNACYLVYYRQQALDSHRSNQLRITQLHT